MRLESYKHNEKEETLYLRDVDEEIGCLLNCLGFQHCDDWQDEDGNMEIWVKQKQNSEAEMKEYEFYVRLCGGFCDGTIKIEAENEDEAYGKAVELVGDKLTDAFPELDIEFDIDLKNTIE